MLLLGALLVNVVVVHCVCLRLLWYEGLPRDLKVVSSMLAAARPADTLTVRQPARLREGDEIKYDPEPFVLPASLPVSHSLFLQL